MMLTKGHSSLSNLYVAQKQVAVDRDGMGSGRQREEHSMRVIDMWMAYILTSESHLTRSGQQQINHFPTCDKSDS